MKTSNSQRANHRPPGTTRSRGGKLTGLQDRNNSRQIGPTHRKSHPATRNDEQSTHFRRQQFAARRPSDGDRARINRPVQFEFVSHGYDESSSSICRHRSR